MVATRSARFSRCVLRCQGSRSPSTALMLRAACSIPPIQTPNPSKNGPSSSRYPTVNHFRPKPIGGETSDHSLRHAPQKHPSVIFYTLSAGQNDEIHCTTVQGRDGCDKGALFDKASNVKAQLNLGAGTPASQLHLNFSDGSLFNQM